MIFCFNIIVKEKVKIVINNNKSIDFTENYLVYELNEINISK